MQVVYCGDVILCITSYLRRNTLYPSTYSFLQIFYERNPIVATSIYYLVLQNFKKIITKQYLVNLFLKISTQSKNKFVNFTPQNMHKSDL